MLKRIILCSVWCVVYSQSVFAQNGTITGKVIDKDTKGGISQVSLEVNNETILGITNEMGEFSIKPKKFPTTWLKNDLSDAHPNALSFSFNRGAGENPTERDNVVHRWGINILDNGLQEIKNEQSLSIEFEELWEIGKRRLTEYHHNLVDTDGQSRRVMTT